MKVCVVVEVAIPIDIECIDDPVVIVINVIPVGNTIAIPIIELGERGALRGAAWIWIHGVWRRHCWAVPSSDIRCLVQWERVVFVLDLIVVKIVFEVACVATHRDVAEVVRGGCSAHVRIEPIVDGVVILIERTEAVVVEVLIVINLTVDVAVVVPICTRDFEIDVVDAGDGDRCAPVATADGDLSSRRVSVPGVVEGDRSH